MLRYLRLSLINLLHDCYTYFLVDTFYKLYNDAERKCRYSESKEKVLFVQTWKKRFRMTEETYNEFAAVQHKFEINITKEYEDDTFISGINLLHFL